MSQISSRGVKRTPNNAWPIGFVFILLKHFPTTYQKNILSECANKHLFTGYTCPSEGGPNETPSLRKLCLTVYFFHKSSKKPTAILELPFLKPHWLFAELLGESRQKLSLFGECSLIIVVFRARYLWFWDDACFDA